MASRNYELIIEIGGSVNQSLTTALHGAQNSVQKMGSAIKRVAAIAGLGVGLDKVKDFAAECVEESQSMETAMANVAKVVAGMKDEHGRITDSYRDMENSIIEMSKYMPMLKEDIAEIVASAGQANIPKEDLLSFAESATKMGIAFDATAEQSGEWMAAWRTAFQLSQNDVVVLADQINYLGNTSSEKAIKLAEIVTNIGSLGQIANLSAADIAAMGAAMTKVNSSVASTGIKNVIKAMTAGTSATKRQAEGFDRIGLSAKSVAEAMQVDSQGTLLDVLERIRGLNKVEQSATISNIFGNVSKASIAPLIANLDNLKEQFAKVGDSALYAGSMEREYMAASSTSANLKTLTDNKYFAMQKEIGDELVPITDEINRTKGQIYDMMSEFVATNSPAISQEIQKIVSEIQKGFPTALYTLQDFAHSVGDVLQPVGEVIGSITERMDLLAGVLAGAFAAKKGYAIALGIGRTAQSIRDLAAAGEASDGSFRILTSLIKHPWALGLGAAAAGIAGVAAAVKVANEEAKKENLAEHFGDMSLSLQELQTTAKGLIQSEYMEQLAESFNAMEKVNSLKGYVNDATNTLNRLNWKVGIGLELDENDRNAYIQNIEQYITDSQEMLDQKQYSVSLNLDILSNGKTGKKLKKDFSKFYKDNSVELQKLGKKLNKTVTKAFSDDLLTIDEAEKIQQIQEQMARITEELAGSEFRAKLKVLEMDTSGQELTADSFQNLMTEANNQKDDVLESLKTTLAETISDTEKLYGKDSKEYEKAIENYQKNYLDQKTDANQSVAQFALNTIHGAYGKEIGSSEDLSKNLSEALSQAIGELENGTANIADVWTPTHLAETLGAEDLSKSTKAALEELWAVLSPQLDQMEVLKSEYLEMGKEIPDSLSKGIMDLGTIGAMLGEQDALFAALSVAVEGSSEYQALLQELEKAGYYIPEELAKGIERNKEGAKSSVQTLYGTTKQDINTTFGKGFQVNVPINLNPIVSGMPYSKKYTKEQQKENRKTIKAPGYITNPGNAGGKTSGKTGGLAVGGIIKKPRLTWFAEEGMEAAIPINGSQRSLDLWKETGELLGAFEDLASPAPSVAAKEYKALSSTAYSATQETGFKVSFSPQIIVKAGEGSKDVQKDVSKGVQASFADFEIFFERMMERYKRKKKRIRQGG